MRPELRFQESNGKERRLCFVRHGKKLLGMEAPRRS
jgi:hypothetical protein